MLELESMHIMLRSGHLPTKPYSHVLYQVHGLGRGVTFSCHVCFSAARATLGRVSIPYVFAVCRSF